MKDDGVPRLEVPEELRRKMVMVARDFRKAPTPSEAILWRALRGKQLEGLKFRRQQPVGPFVVDFYCPQCRLVVEVDGPIHETQREADRSRQSLLEELGLRFVRVSAGLVENDLPAALGMIQAALQEASPSGAPAPLSPCGRGVGGEGIDNQENNQ
jgi:very-short-patch-repair endonuclease